MVAVLEGKTAKSKSGQLLDMVGLLWRLDFPPWGILFRRKLVRKQTSLLWQSNLQSEGGFYEQVASKDIKTVSFVVLQFFTTSTTTGVTASHFFAQKRHTE